ncbi:helix-turn-helix domain-containing protein [Paenibacillus polymyxa]|uniref:helix-turn-helix domain-containing protein n=1 Tax=Paenibacillus polymyxa TaxID=1406 RepID=UPI0032AF153D
MPIVKATPQLKKIMGGLGLKQMQLSEMAKVNQPFISKFDKTENYSIHNLISIARALNMSVEDLFTIEEIPDVIEYKKEDDSLE